MARLSRRPVRRAVGIAAAVSATAFSTWLLLALFSDIPTPEFSALNQSGIRLLAELTVVSLLVAAIAFWDEPLT